MPYRSPDAFRVHLIDTFRSLEDAIDIQNAATQLLGKYTGANRVGYAEAQPERGKVAVTRNYINGVPSLEGVYSYDDYGKQLYNELLAGRTVVRPDVAADPFLTKEEKEAHATLQLGATVNVPFLKGSQLVAILFVHYISAHYWTEEEISLFKEVAERTWEAVQRARAEESLRRSEEVLSLAIQSADIGLWQIDLTDNRTVLSDRMKTIHGIPLDREITFDEALSTIVEEHRQSVNDKVVKAVETNELFVADYKINRMDGSGTGWVRSTGIVKNYKEGSKKMLIGACIDITENKADEQRKNDFIGMVSHEMKTPLTTLSVYLQLLQMKAQAQDGPGRDMLSKANLQVNRITNLINGFLNVSRLESGKIQVDKQRFNMAALMKEAEEEVRATVMSHRVVFYPVDAVYVNADRDKINQVITNLISNAGKYSPDNTTIHVACLRVDSNAVVSVQDEGIGIKEEDRVKIFDRYYRVSSSNKIASGFGIGLYLCHEIIRHHEGKIWVESEVGKGSTFFFSLPVVE